MSIGRHPTEKVEILHIDEKKNIMKIKCLFLWVGFGKGVSVCHFKEFNV